MSARDVMLPVIEDHPREEHPMSALSPFTTAEEAWFWTVRALRMREEGAPWRQAPQARPCDPDDVIRAVDKAWRKGLLSPAHLRLLRLFGGRGHAPNADGQASELAVWREALAAVEPLLQAKEIVA